MNYENVLYAIALGGGNGGGGGGDVEQIIAEVMERVAAGYYNKSQTDAIVSAIETGKILIVDELPATGGPKDIYFIRRPAPLKGYNEWMYIDDEWEEIGDTSIDLSNYYNKSEIDAMMSVVPTQADIDAIYRQIGSVETKADDAKYVAQQAQQEAANVEELARSKQDALESGTNIKTINQENILGEGNLVVGNVVIERVESGVLYLSYKLNGLVDFAEVYSRAEADVLLADKQNALTKADILALLGYEEITISIKDENDNVVTKKILAEVDNNG